MTNKTTVTPEDTMDSCTVEADSSIDPINDHDRLRGQCPMVHHHRHGWVVLRHAEVLDILNDHDTFSNAVSTHLSVPNGMDPPEHEAYRKIVDKYFTPERMAEFAAPLRVLCSELVFQCDGEIDLVQTLAKPFSVRAQCTFMGWPDSLHEPLLKWIEDNHEATRTGDRNAQVRVAHQFDHYIREQLEIRREDASAGLFNDITGELLTERVNNQPLSDEMLVSLIRNWTVGELGTITACVSIICHYLAQRPDIQALLRHNPQMRAAAVEEILRIEGPLHTNRRICTREVDIGGQTLPAGERITVLWTSANRDETVFGRDPGRFNLNRNPEDNLLYGKGIHACPGAPLARMELGMLLDELLNQTTQIEVVAGEQAVQARYPSSGYSQLALHFTRACRREKC